MSQRQHEPMDCFCDQYHDVVRDYHGPKGSEPEVCAVVGEPSDQDQIDGVVVQLTLQGYLVLPPSNVPYQLIPQNLKSIDGVLGSDVKLALDELDRRKIDLADYLYVVNPQGRIGYSTRNAIQYALEHAVEVTYLVPPPEVPAGLRKVTDGSGPE